MGKCNSVQKSEREKNFLKNSKDSALILKIIKKNASIIKTFSPTPNPENLRPILSNNYHHEEIYKDDEVIGNEIQEDQDSAKMSNEDQISGQMEESSDDEKLEVPPKNLKSARLEERLDTVSEKNSVCYMSPFEIDQLKIFEKNKLRHKNNQENNLETLQTSKNNSQPIL